VYARADEPDTQSGLLKAGSAVSKAPTRQRRLETRVPTRVQTSGGSCSPGAIVGQSLCRKRGSGGGDRQLKAQEGKPIIAHAEPALPRSLVAAGLIDQYALIDTSGRGRQRAPALFWPCSATDFQARELNSVPRGAVAQIYRPA